LLQGGPTDFSGIFEGEVKLFIGQSPSVKMGTIGITDENTFLPLPPGRDRIRWSIRPDCASKQPRPREHQLDLRNLDADEGGQ
jgi:hypothetical protein